MELWVRSQDKDILMKVVVLEANDDNSIYTTNRNTLVRLGKYKTKERALEILDEIQKLLIPRGIIKYNSLLHQEDIEKLRNCFNNNYIVTDKNVELLQQFETLVYEMPKE